MPSLRRRAPQPTRTLMYLLADKNVLLCVSGGIAAYKTASLVSALVQRSVAVTVAMTENATNLIANPPFVHFKKTIHTNAELLEPASQFFSNPSRSSHGCPIFLNQGFFCQIKGLGFQKIILAITVGCPGNSTFTVIPVQQNPVHLTNSLSCL